MAFRVAGHIEMQYAPTIMVNKDEAVEKLEGDSVDGEEDADRCNEISEQGHCSTAVYLKRDRIISQSKLLATESRLCDLMPRRIYEDQLHFQYKL